MFRVLLRLCPFFPVNSTISPFCCRQGEWKPREIDNPAYKGKWIHPEIDNPEYTPDAEIYKYDSIGVIGLDLWQVKIELVIPAEVRKQTPAKKKQPKK